MSIGVGAAPNFPGQSSPLEPTGSGNPSGQPTGNGGTRVWNNFKGRDPDLIFAGETLKLPNGETYVVRAGDTLTSIAAATGLALQQLMDHNGFDVSLLGPNAQGQQFTPGGPTPQPGGSVHPAPNNGTTTPGAPVNGNGSAPSAVNGLPTADEAAGMLRGMRPGAATRNPPPDDFRGSEGGQLRSLLKTLADNKPLSPEQQQQLKDLLARWTPTNVPSVQ